MLVLQLRPHHLRFPRVRLRQRAWLDQIWQHLLRKPGGTQRPQRDYCYLPSDIGTDPQTHVGTDPQTHAPAYQILTSHAPPNGRNDFWLLPSERSHSLYDGPRRWILLH